MNSIPTSVLPPPSPAVSTRGFDDCTGPFLSRFGVADGKQLAGIHALAKNDACTVGADNRRCRLLHEPLAIVTAANHVDPDPEHNALAAPRCAPFICFQNYRVHRVHVHSLDDLSAIHVPRTWTLAVNKRGIDP
jgi:hypothetical protein